VCTVLRVVPRPMSPEENERNRELRREVLKRRWALTI
jgi:hypothetical protein